MAYMSQENKKKIAEGLKKVIPAGWKWSLGVHHHSTLNLTISAAPIDLIGVAQGWQKRNEPRPEYYGLNEYYLHFDFEGELLKTFEAIKAAMMVGNHNNSDIQSDYFDVGWYISISFGRWERPFKFLDRMAAAAVPAQPVLPPAGYYEPTEYGQAMSELARWVTLCPEISVTAA